MADKELTDFESQLRDMAVSEDAGIDSALSEVAPPESSAEVTPPAEGKSEATPQPVAKETPAETKETPIEETPFAKAKREGKEREAKAWEKIVAEKAAIAEERKKLAAETRAKTAVQPGPLRDQHGYSRADYERFAKEFDRLGEDENAETARQTAELLGKQESQHQAKQYERSVLDSIDEVLAERPEFKDYNGSNGQRVQAIFKEFPILAQIPGGLKAAISLLDAREGGTKVSELTKQLEGLRAENQRLQGLTSLPKPHPSTGKTADKKLNEMNIDEAGDYLRRKAEEVDAA